MKFMPDYPPETPNIWVTCDGFHPDRYGNHRTGWMAQELLATGLTRAFNEVKFCPYPAGASINSNIVAINPAMVSPANPASVCIYNGSTWDDRTGGTAAHTGRQESIAQLGNITVIGTPSNGCFSRDATTTSAFAAVAGSPNCDILVLNGLNILVALGGGGSDAWYTSDIASTDFTAGGSSVASSGNLRQTPGKITAGIAFGNDIIAFKNRGVYRGTFTNSGDIIWQWQVMRQDLGAWGPGSVVATGDRVFFIGDQGFWSFDGYNFQREDEGIWKALRTFLTTGVSGDYVGTKLAFDWATRLVTVHARGVPVSSGVRTRSVNSFYSFHVDSRVWGYQSRVENTATNTAYPTIADGFQTSYGASGPSPATGIVMFDAGNNKLVSVSDTFAPASLPVSNPNSDFVPVIGTGRIGQRLGKTQVGPHVIPLWTIADGSGTSLSTATYKVMTPFAADSVMETMTERSGITLSTDQYWADYQWTAQWHKFNFGINCEAVISGVDIPQKPAGKY